MAKERDVRGMYLKIKQEKNGFQARSHMCENTKGELITESSRILETGAWDFEELLNLLDGIINEDYTTRRTGPSGKPTVT